MASTYYNVGEWFLGMIILLYIIFPFLLLLFKKLPLATMLSSIFLYVIFLNQSIINRVPLWSITSCLISFVLGMVIVKYKNQIVNKYSAMISFVAVIILNFIKLNQSSNVCIHLMSAYLFILLMFVGEWIMKNKILSKTFFEISSISYAVFLLQHRIIYGILSIFNPQSSLKIFTLLIATIFVILVASKLLTLFTDILKKGITKLIKHIRT